MDYTNKGKDEICVIRVNSVQYFIIFIDHENIFIDHENIARTDPSEYLEAEALLFGT